MGTYEGEEYWTEVTQSGRQIRGVRHALSGDTWERLVPRGMNPMSDLYAPMYDDREITEAEFEQLWERAR